MKKIMQKALLVLFIAVFGMTMLVGCGDDGKTGIESGFSGGGGKPSNPFMIAYRSEVTEFDKYNVSLTLYYGSALATMDDHPRDMNLYITNGEKAPLGSSEWILIKTIPGEEFYTDDYDVNPTAYDSENFVTNWHYNHSETLNIPSELFDKQIGKIYISIYASERDGGAKWIYYRLDGDRVTLSDKPFAQE